MQKGSPFLRIFRKKAAFNVLSKPHQSERCALCAHRAQNSILKSTHFVLPEHKTVSPHHPRRAFCALRAQNSAPHALPRRISRPAGAKQPTARTPPAHFAPCGRETAHRTQASQTLPPRTAANRRRRLSRPQTRNNFDRKSPRHARGDLHFSLCACRSRPAGGKARSRVQSLSKTKGNGFAVPFRFRIYIRLSPPVPSSLRRWGGSCRR